MKPGLFMYALMGVGFVAMAGAFALAVSSVLEAPGDPRRTGAWFVVILFGALLLRIVPFVIGLFRRKGALAEMTEQGITNLKDRIGPIPWAEIRGARIHELGYVRYVGHPRVLYVEVAEAAARAHRQRATLSFRWFTPLQRRNGSIELPVMSYPPYTYPQLEEALANIQVRIGVTSGTRP